MERNRELMDLQSTVVRLREENEVFAGQPEHLANSRNGSAMPSTRRGGASREIRAPPTIVAYAHSTERVGREDGAPPMACNTESAMPSLPTLIPGGARPSDPRGPRVAPGDNTPGARQREDQCHDCVRHRVCGLHAEQQASQQPAGGEARRRDDD